MSGDNRIDGLDREKRLKMLSAPFPDKEINWKPKPSKEQTDLVKKDYTNGVRCTICGGWHHPKAVHLAYVGHAATTKRILDVDPEWSWDFLCTDERGLPVYDPCGGLWINLTILGVTRKGYGDAGGDSGPDAVKEIIGDAIRNAAMRFGVALELWHKGEFAKDVTLGESSTEVNQGESATSDGDFYPENQFDANFPLWKKQIEAGSKTADKIISFLGKKGARLSQSQINKINGVGK